MTAASPTPNPARPWPSLALVLASVGLLTATSFRNGFVHDDLQMIRAGVIDDPSNIPALFVNHTLALHGSSAVMALDTYRPLSALSFFWDAWLSGDSPWSYHLTNWLLHLATVALVFALLRRLTAGSVRQSALFALLFGLSPQLVEAHAWINGRSDVLAAMFGAAALLAADGAASAPSARRALGLGSLAALAFLCGLLAKEPLALALPVLLFWPGEVRPVRRLMPLAGAAALYVLLRSQALGGLAGGGGVDHVARAMAQLPILLSDGALELVAPHRLFQRNLREDYAAVPSWAAAALALAWLGLFALALRARTRAPAFLFGLALFVATLAPAAMISAHDVRWPGFGRYLYLPAVGLCIALASLVAVYGGPVLSRARGAVMAVAALSLVWFALGTLRYTRAYASDLALHEAALAAQPESAAAHAGVAGVLASAGRNAEALAAYRRALTLDPNQPAYALQVAFFALQGGDAALAAVTCRTAIARLPESNAALFRPLLVRALADRDAPAALDALCDCLGRPDSARRCEGVALGLAQANGPHARALAAALPTLDGRCPADVRARIVRIVGP